VTEPAGERGPLEGSPDSASDPRPGLEHERGAGEQPRWASMEIAWPLALVCGFAGTWAGLSTGWPGAAALLGTAALAPLHLAFIKRCQPGAAALLSLGWGLGIAGAVAGSVFEGAGAEVARSLPALSWLEADSIGGAGAATTVLLHLGLFACALMAGRWSHGLGTLLAASLVVAAAALEAAQSALPSVVDGAHAVLGTLAHLPPSLTGEALALLIAGAGLSRPGGVSEYARARTRPILLGALALEFLALAGWSLG